MTEPLYLGNTGLLNSYKTAFMCSRVYKEEILIKAKNWALERINQNTVFISGFHSPIEKEIFKLLLEENQKIIYVLARSFKKKYEPAVQKSLDNGDMLIISPFSQKITRPTLKTSTQRNKYIIYISDEVFIAHAQKNGSIYNLINDVYSKYKLFRPDASVNSFEIKENIHHFRNFLSKDI